MPFLTPGCVPPGSVNESFIIGGRVRMVHGHRIFIQFPLGPKIHDNLSKLGRQFSTSYNRCLGI